MAVPLSCLPACPLASVLASLCPRSAASDAKGKEREGSKGPAALDDDTLKCTICHDLCVRPVTVRPLVSPAAQGRGGIVMGAAKHGTQKAGAGC